MLQPPKLVERKEVKEENASDSSQDEWSDAEMTEDEAGGGDEDENEESRQYGVVKCDQKLRMEISSGHCLIRNDENVCLMALFYSTLMSSSNGV